MSWVARSGSTRVPSDGGGRCASALLLHGERRRKVRRQQLSGSISPARTLVSSRAYSGTRPPPAKGPLRVARSNCGSAQARPPEGSAWRRARSADGLPAAAPRRTPSRVQRRSTGAATTGRRRRLTVGKLNSADSTRSTAQTPTICGGNDGTHSRLGVAKSKFGPGADAAPAGKDGMISAESTPSASSGGPPGRGGMPDDRQIRPRWPVGQLCANCIEQRPMARVAN
jgi:hypothetical protein